MPSETSSHRVITSNSISLSDSSVTLSKYSFQPLVDSLLLSPRVPFSESPHGKKRKHFGSGLRSILSWSFGICLILWSVLTIVRSRRSSITFGYFSNSDGKFELAELDSLPPEPAPIIITDRRWTPKWTVSIPPTEEFPLRPSEYANICSKSQSVAKHVLELKSHRALHGLEGHFPYYHVDTNFVDVYEAEEHGIVPKSEPRRKEWSWESMASISGTEQKGSTDKGPKTPQSKGQDNVCEKSLTYVMESGDAGLGRTLMGLWMSYGLAMKEERAFFVDDSNWAYGKYTTYFRPPPSPSCRPPPYTRRLPCPHQARHLLVSASTTSWTFGHNFNEQFEDAHKVGVLRQVHFFALLRTGYDALFHLAKPDAEYLDERLAHLDTNIYEKGGLAIGVHVRHGDRHPLEYKYQKSYIPSKRYAEAATDLIEKEYAVVGDRWNMSRESASKIILASDDPTVYTSSDLSNALRAQEQILIASKSGSGAMQASGKKLAEDDVTWDGGFFEDVFWSLGKVNTPETGGSAHDPRAAPSKLALSLRESVARAYFLDLAVVGRADRIVCGVSSVGCRLLAVIMGWEDAIVLEKWHNIDGDFDWKGIAW